MAGKFVVLAYETEFTEGKATEQFTFRVKNEQAFLVGYNINSMALIVK